MVLGVVAVDVEVEFGVELVERRIGRLAAGAGAVVGVAVDPVAVVVVMDRVGIVVRPGLRRRDLRVLGGQVGGDVRQAPVLGVQLKGVGGEVGGGFGVAGG
jgi:hypothetical protein